MNIWVGLFFKTKPVFVREELKKQAQPVSWIRPCVWIHDCMAAVYAMPAHRPGCCAPQCVRSENQGRMTPVRSCSRHANDPALEKGQEHTHTVSSWGTTLSCFKPVMHPSPALKMNNSYQPVRGRLKLMAVCWFTLAEALAQNSQNHRWLRLEGTSGGHLVSNLDRPFDRAMYTDTFLAGTLSPG